MLVHTTGGGLVAKAKALGVDPEAFAVEYYRDAGNYPHYLIAHDGSIYNFCDELRWAAHAAWQPIERSLYAGDWATSWINVLGDGKLRHVERSFYAVWFERWKNPSRPAVFSSPKELVAAVGGTSPNEAYIGVELLDSKPFTAAQHEALAALFSDIRARHGLHINGILPVPTFCTHSDVGPLRRWQRSRSDKGATPSSGFAWDPLVGQLDWRLVEQKLT